MSDLQKFNSAIKSTNTQDYLNVVLGSNKESFVTSLVSLVGADEKLQACEPVTLIYAAAKATALRLPIENNLGFAWIVPFRDTKRDKTIATFQIGAKGFQQLASRSGKYKTINVSDVREGEIVGRDRMTGEIKFKWLDDAERETKAIIGYVGYFKLLNGYEKTIYATVSELDAHGKKYSQTYRKGYGLWKDDFHAMCRKTIIKMLLSKGDAPLSIEMQEAIKFDQSMINSNGEPVYVDNQPKSSDDEQAKDFLEDAKVIEESKNPQEPEQKEPAQKEEQKSPGKKEPVKDNIVYDENGNALFEE